MRERRRIEIAERLLEDPQLANAQAAEIERLEKWASNEGVAEPGPPAELAQRLVQHEIEVMELRARLRHGRPRAARAAREPVGRADSASSRRRCRTPRRAGDASADGDGAAEPAAELESELETCARWLIELEQTREGGGPRRPRPGARVAELEASLAELRDAARRRGRGAAGGARGGAGGAVGVGCDCVCRSRRRAGGRARRAARPSAPPRARARRPPRGAYERRARRGVRGDSFRLGACVAASDASAAAGRVAGSGDLRSTSCAPSAPPRAARQADAAEAAAEPMCSRPRVRPANEDPRARRAPRRARPLAPRGVGVRGVRHRRSPG